jgi:hypothetical protein
LFASGHAAGFDIKLWRCLICEAHERASFRVDGKTFWIGAMGRAIWNETWRVIAESYAGSPPGDHLA